MKKESILFSALSLFLFMPALGYADISVVLKLDRREASLQDSVGLVVSVSGARKSDSRPLLKGLESFYVKQGGTSSRVELVNGKLSSGVDYTYSIQPKKSGTFELGPAEVTIKGKTIRSNTERLTVLEPAHVSGDDSNPLFLTAKFSSTQVYVEEQTIYTLKLYYRARVKEFFQPALPKAEYLAFRQLGEHVKYESVYNGRSYQVLELRYALIPSREGKYGIAPSRMQLTLLRERRRSPRSLFGNPFSDDPFFSSAVGESRTLASEPLELVVLPLPEEGRPSGFSGLVGTFEIESSLDPSSVRAGDSATLTVFLSGRGNVKRMPDLDLPRLEQVKVYADQPVLDEGMDAGGVVGSKTMKWALVPEKEGDYSIAPLSVSFFDTTTHQYQTLNTSVHSLEVLPDGEDHMQATIVPRDERLPADHTKQAIEEVGHDIFPLHSSLEGFVTGPGILSGGAILWAVIFVPPLSYWATFLGLRLRKRSTGLTAATRARKAARKLIRRYRQGDVGSGDLALWVRDYLNERFGLAHGTLTPEEATVILRSRGVSVETAEKLRTLLQELENAVYAGRGGEISRAGERLPGMVKKIERELR